MRHEEIAKRKQDDEDAKLRWIEEQNKKLMDQRTKNLMLREERKLNIQK